VQRQLKAADRAFPPVPFHRSRRPHPLRHKSRAIVGALRLTSAETAPRPTLHRQM
jgi:hypothetical protein